MLYIFSVHMITNILNAQTQQTITWRCSRKPTYPPHLRNNDSSKRRKCADSPFRDIVRNRGASVGRACVRRRSRIRSGRRRLRSRSHARRVLGAAERLIRAGRCAAGILLCFAGLRCRCWCWCWRWRRIWYGSWRGSCNWIGGRWRWGCGGYA